jgi:hypothetical protein
MTPLQQGAALETHEALILSNLQVVNHFHKRAEKTDESGGLQSPVDASEPSCL